MRPERAADVVVNRHVGLVFEDHVGVGERIGLNDRAAGEVPGGATFRVERKT